MDRASLCSRRFYRCSYCNAMFLQVDAWQRHNRKHAGLEIECDDCGYPCVDYADLMVHQQQCDASRLYTRPAWSFSGPREHPLETACQPLCTLESDERSQVADLRHQAPDSTSRSDNASNVSEIDFPVVSTTSDVENGGERSVLKSGNFISPNPNRPNPCIRTTGNGYGNEVQVGVCSSDENIGSGGAGRIRVANEVVCVDEKTLTNAEEVDHGSEVDTASQGSHPDSQIRSDVDNTRKQEMRLKFDRYYNLGNSEHCSTAVRDPASPSLLNVINENSGTHVLRPYFCKRCGARFTRKDSLTRHVNKGSCKGKAPSVCDICRSAHHSAIELYEHMKVAHKSIPIPSKTCLSDRGRKWDFRQLETLSTTYHGRENKISQLGHQREVLQMTSRAPGLPLRGNRLDDGDSGTPCPAGRQEASSYGLQQALVGPPIVALSPNLVNETVSERCVERFGGVYDSASALISCPNAAASTKLRTDVSTRNKIRDTEKPTLSYACNVCSCEFPKFEYLLTHLRKHKVDVGKFREEHCGVSASPPSLATACFESVGNRCTSSAVGLPSPEAGALIKSNEKSPADTLMAPYSREPDQQPGTSDPQFAVSVTGGAPHVSSCVQPNAKLAGLRKGSIASTPNTVFDGQRSDLRCESGPVMLHVRRQQCVEDRKEFKCELCCKVFPAEGLLNQHKGVLHGEETIAQCRCDEVHGSGSAPGDIDSRRDLGSEFELTALSKKTAQPKALLQCPIIESQVGVRLDRSRSFVGTWRSPPVTDDCATSHAPVKDTSSFNCLSQELFPTAVAIDEGAPADGKVGSVRRDTNTSGYGPLPRPYVCQYCGDAFTHRPSLRRHARSHLGIGVPCKECGKLYRNKSEWCRHQRNFHRRAVSNKDAPAAISVTERNFGDTAFVSFSDYLDKTSFSCCSNLLDVSASDGDSDSIMDVDRATSNVDGSKNANCWHSDNDSNQSINETVSEAIDGQFFVGFQTSSDISRVSGSSQGFLVSEQARKCALKSYLGSCPRDDGVGTTNSELKSNLGGTVGYGIKIKSEGANDSPTEVVFISPDSIKKE